MNDTPSKPKSPPFVCLRCNQCCQGRGGIVMRPGQIAPAAALLGISAEEFMARFCEPHGRDFSIVCGEDGQCALLGPEGCRIHQAKPDICKRWPFFEALIKDAGAFEEAKLICPGLKPEASHEEFRAYALQELDKESHKP